MLGKGDEAAEAKGACGAPKGEGASERAAGGAFDAVEVAGVVDVDMGPIGPLIVLVCCCRAKMRAMAS